MKFGMLFSEWIVNSHDEEDFGFDFEIRPTERSESGFYNVKPSGFYAQLKASEEFEGETEISFDMEVDYLLEECLSTTVPVMLALYDRGEDEFYWCILQKYCWDILEENKSNWRDQETVRLKIQRKPLSATFQKHILRTEVKKVQDRIAFRRYIGEIKTVGSPSNAEDLSDNSSTEEYKHQRLDLVRQLLNSGNKSRALSELIEIYNMPGEDRGKLEAIIQLLESREITDPVIAVAQRRFAVEGLYLCEKYEITEYVDSLREKKFRAEDYIDRYFVGARVFDSEADEEAIVLDVEDWLPDEESQMLAAILQYEDGILYDASAGGFGGSRFEFIESGESNYPLDGACDEDKHDFEASNYRELGETDFCIECGLSRQVLAELLDHSLRKSMETKCTNCDDVIPSSMDLDEIGIGIDGEFLCHDCSNQNSVSSQ
ncbi:DUF4365 domain-containing protein [Halosimplex halophilum]|uniref:DUF4365 domain-containing protein n=1 Tax=Halosimplex halophilum TaxID=2559572 RepID=UPI001435649D|nr:DUF4365 domain-containing protein [Halosimplex halophilum]